MLGESWIKFYGNAGAITRDLTLTDSQKEHLDRYDAPVYFRNRETDEALIILWNDVQRVYVVICFNKGVDWQMFSQLKDALAEPIEF